MPPLRSYNSIRKPSLSSGTRSSFSLSSIAKKQQSAEDAIFDSQYEDGLMSPEVYKQKLAERLGRGTLTPLQKVTIQEKIKSVDERVLDSRYEQAYANGQITTEKYRDYEKSKLEKMMDQNNPSYIKQLQKVQGLTDKAEREARTAFRVQENLRISQMPEDNSDRLYQKAALYQRLAEQARLDGDEQQAQTFETQLNNYTSSAKRAEVNDLISSVRLNVSDSPSQGLGVPSAEGGANVLASLTGQATQSPSTAARTSGTSPVLAPARFTSPAEKNALESLDRTQKTIDRLYQQKQDRAQMIAAYQEAVNRATGDQKTQLQIQLNNLIDGDKQLDNSIAQATQNIQDTVARIQETRAAAAKSNFSREARKTELLIARDEDLLEKNFAQGKLSRDEYLSTAIDLLERKRQFYDEASNGFATFGDESKADSYLEKFTNADGMKGTYQDVMDSPDDYEVIASDPGGKLTNLSGKPVAKGERVLTNVRQLKDDGSLDSNYVKVGDVYHRIYYPATNSEVTGLPNTRAWNKDLGVLQNNAFVYVDGKKQNIKSVKAFNDQGVPENKLILESDLKKDLDAKKVIQEGNTFRYRSPQEMQTAPGAKKSFIQNLFDNVKAGAKMGLESMGKTNIFGGVAIPSAQPKTSQQTQSYLDKSNVTDLLSGARRGVTSALERFNLVPKAYAAEKRPDVGNPDNLQAIKNALEAEGILDENTLAYALATIDHETAGQFRPVNEGYYADKGVAPGTTGRREALKRGYSGGENFYGRGYIQLTHDYNYKAMDKRLGLNGALVRNPELANDPEIAARILAAFFKDRGVAKAASTGNFIEARKGINGYDKAKEIAAKATQYTQKARDLIAPPAPVEAEESRQPGMNLLDRIVPKAYAASGAASTLRSSVPQSSQPALRSSSPTPSIQSLMPSQTAQPSAQLRSTSMPKVSTPMKLPTISLPKISIPQISVPKPVQNIVSTVQKAATPVVNTVKNVVSNIGKTLSNLNPFKKR